jgi:hypothetical protein
VRNDVPAPKVPDAAMDAIAASYEKMRARAQGPRAEAVAAPRASNVAQN